MHLRVQPLVPPPTLIINVTTFVAGLCCSISLSRTSSVLRLWEAQEGWEGLLVSSAVAMVLRIVIIENVNTLFTTRRVHSNLGSWWRPAHLGKP